MFQCSISNTVTYLFVIKKTYIQALGKSHEINPRVTQ